MEALSDNRLMLRVKEGDLDQLGLLFERYHRALFGFFYNKNKDVTLSEDLVQNVFVRILKYKHRYRGDGEFKNWLFHIARNVNVDHYRKKRIKHTEPIENWQEQIEDQGLNKSQQMMQDEELRQLRLALQKLDPEKREVIVMSKLQGLRYKEIGQLLGCSEGAVKVKVFRAMKALKGSFGEGRTVDFRS